MKYLLSELKYIYNGFFIKINPYKEYKQFKREGLLVKKNFLTKDQCENLISQIDLNIKNEKISWKDKEESDVRIFNFKSKTKIFKSENIDLESFYRKYISSVECNKFIMANKLVAKENNLGSGGGWHRDNLNRRQLKFMIYLNDVNEDNGAFQYIPKTHKVSSKLFTNSLSNNFRYSPKKISKLYPEKSIKLSAKAGTLIVFDSSGLHRGSPILKGKRYALTQYMFDSPIPRHIKNLFV